METLKNLSPKTLAFAPFCTIFFKHNKGEYRNLAPLFLCFVDFRLLGIIYIYAWYTMFKDVCNFLWTGGNRDVTLTIEKKNL